MVLKLRAPLACRIAGVDRDRFNEAVARGDYPNAPKAGPGNARLFLMHDVIGLFVYRLFLDLGMTSRNAGEIAGGVVDLAKRSLNLAPRSRDAGRPRSPEDAEKVTAVVTLSQSGEVDYHLSDEVSPTDRETQLGPNMFSINIQLGNIRKIIEAGIEDYRATLGEEETLG